MRPEGALELNQHKNRAFTETKNSLALFQSDNGFQWELSHHFLVSTPQVNWQEHGLEKLERLERPQLWLNDGIPAVLFCTAKEEDRTFNVHIPMVKHAHNEGKPHRNGP